MSVRDEYLAFAGGQAAGVSPTYEALARAAAADDRVGALLAELPRPGVALPPRPRGEGPEAFPTALDGIPVGWSPPHGQFCD